MRGIIVQSEIFLAISHSSAGKNWLRFRNRTDGCFIDGSAGRAQIPNPSEASASGLTGDMPRLVPLLIATVGNG